MGTRQSAAKDDVVSFADDQSPKAKGRVAPEAEVLLRDYSSLVLLSLRCEELRKGRNTRAVVYSKLSTEDLWTEYGSTEICGQDTRWPVWEKMFELQFRIEFIRYVRVEIYIIRNQTMQEDLMEQKFVGSAEFNLAEAVYARSSTKHHGWLKKKLENVRRKPRDPPLGKLLVFAEESINAKVELSFQMSGADLKSTDFWKRKCDPYFMVNRIEGVFDTGELTLLPVFKSEVARKTGEPTFEESSYTAAQISACDIYQDVIITVHDWFRFGEHRYIGECVTSFEELQKIVGRGNPHTFPLYKREGPRLAGMTRLRTSASMLRSQTKSSRSGSGSRSGSNSRAASALSADRVDSKRKSTLNSGEKRTTSRLTARTPSQISGGGHRTSSQISGHSRMTSHSSGGTQTQSLTSSELRNQQGAKGAFGPLAGQVTLDGHRFKRHYTFLDYLRGGLELQLMVAIDFTRSNLGQTNPKSMHSVVKMDEETAYATAIRALGEVMSVYDNDNSYPIYGFGAKIPPSHSVVSNCFALTGDFFQPEVEGVEGMLKAYHRALRACHLHGPSYLADTIKLAANMARPYIQPKILKMTETPPEMKYFVLLVLTDGDVEDQEEVVRQIRECAGIPLSVIFVGIGVSQDFKFLRELAKDIGQILKLNGEGGETERELQLRQLVHFIAFKDHADDPRYLSSAALSHLPRDIVRYYMANGIKPRGLHRFEDKDGNPLPKYIPKEPINSQAVPVKALRIPSGSGSTSRDTSKVAASRSGTNLNSSGGSKSPHRSKSPASSRVTSKSGSVLKLDNVEAEEEEEPWPEEVDSDEEDRKSKDGENKLGVFLEEERLRLINNGVGLGYEKFRIMRAIRDGLPSSALDVLIDNMLHGGYGHQLTYKDAAVAALSDAEFLTLPGMAPPGSPSSALDMPGYALDKSRVGRRLRIGSDEDDEDIDYGERLRELSRPSQSLDRRLEGRLGLLPRDRIATKDNTPGRDRTATASSAGTRADIWEAVRVEDGSAARTLLELSASRNESKDEAADRAVPANRGATKTLEEAAGALTRLQNKGSKGPSGSKGIVDPSFQAIHEADEDLRAAGMAEAEMAVADVVSADDLDP